MIVTNRFSLPYLLDVVELAPEPVVRLDGGGGSRSRYLSMMVMNVVWYVSVYIHACRYTCIHSQIDFAPALESAITPRYAISQVIH